MLTIMFLVAALIHEMGHLIAIILCRCKILKIKLTVFGGVIKYRYIIYLDEEENIDTPTDENGESTSLNLVLAGGE